jgi:transglutaminase-like putative cysteine protease
MIKKYFFVLLLVILLISSCQTIGFNKTLEQYFEDIKSFVIDKTDESENIPEREKINIEQPNLEPTKTVLHTAGRVDTSIYRIHPINPIVKKVPREIKQNVFSDPVQYLPMLVSYLMENVEDPFMKVKIIHDWIADNIAYDSASYFSGNLPVQGYINTLRSKKSVCEGYADLFMEMSRLADIQSHKISGFARGAGYSIFEIDNVQNSNHAWNAVYINDGWYFVDVTWDSGHLNGRNYKKDYKTVYLFLEPYKMLYTHYPTLTSWQLLETIITAEDFQDLPSYRGNFFQTGLEVLDGVKKINFCDNSAELLIPTPEDTFLSATVIDETGKKYDSRDFVQKDGNETIITAAFPFPGKWILRIYAKSKEESMGSWVVDIGYISSTDSNLKFPVQYANYQENGFFLYSPLGVNLSVGEKTDIKIMLPGYKTVFIDTGSNRISLERDGDIFSSSLTIPNTSKLSMFGSTSASARSYEGIMAFSVLK